MKEKIIGIDLGTTNSVVAILDENDINVLENPNGKRTTPSVVAWKNNEWIIGENAKRQLETNPDSVASIKRQMGMNKKINLNDKEYRPEEISAKILIYLKKFAEDKLGQKINKAIITVPAYFDNNQKEATRIAGEIAGFEVQRILNEPTAAAMYYGYKQNINQKKRILVYDLGGGTFDVSLLELNDGVYNVLATSGDSELGGDDWDNAIVQLLIEKINKQHEIKIENNKMAMARLKEASEKAKIDLSGMISTNISLPFLANDEKNNQPINFEIVLTRNEFEKITNNLLLKTKIPIEKALQEANMTVNEIDDILMVGGSTRMPAVKNFVKEIFNKEPNLTVNPDEVVAQGAAIQGAILSKEVKSVLLLDVIPLSLGTSDYKDNFCVIIPSNTTIPVTKKNSFTTVEDNQTEINFPIYQGEHKIGSKNKLIGTCTLSGLNPRPAGEAHVICEFSMDVNGLLKVTASDMETQQEAYIEIKNSNGISKEEIDKMKKNAESENVI